MKWYWAAWLLVGFLVPEMWALWSHKPENTLSETVWHWCDVTPGKTIGTWTLIHIAVAFFMIWLTGHIIFGWWSKL